MQENSLNHDSVQYSGREMLEKARNDIKLCIVGFKRALQIELSGKQHLQHLKQYLWVISKLKSFFMAFSSASVAF